MANNITMLIMSCDKFSDLWDGHIKLLEQNWPDRNMDTFIVTDAPTEKEYPGIQIINAGSEVEWSERLAYALKHVKTEYVFITLDDYFLINKVSNCRIIALLEMIENEGLDYVRLFPRPKRATLNELPQYKGVYWINTKCVYSVNLYSGIWRKVFIESTVKTPKNAWQFEVSLYLRAEEYGAKCVVSNRNDFMILDVVRKGKLLHKSALFFKRHPGIYTGNRETNSWSYEIKLTLQQQISRHLPLWVTTRIKSFLRKRGMHFYSDDAD